MLRYLKWVRSFPAIVLSFSLLVPAHYFFNDAHFAGPDFTSADVSFENLNQEGIPFDHLSGLKIFGTNSLPGVLAPRNHIDEGFLLSISRRFFLVPKILPLRR